MIKSFLAFVLLLLSAQLINSQVVQEWAGHYGSHSNGIYNVCGPVLDNSGNVYLSGSLIGASLTDYVTIKYNANGAEVWSRIFTGLIEDRVVDMAADNAGNVYVTGLSENTTGTYDILTIKYGTDGDSLWVKKYNGASPTAMDQPVALTVDHFNNIYITGYSFGTVPLTYVTIKYNAQGDSLWVARYPSGGTDLPRDIICDNSGNVYLYARGTRIIKYNSSGNLLWSKLFPFEAAESNKVLASDTEGNIYFAAIKNTATFGDFAAVKLNSSGDTLWTRVRNGFGSSQSTHDEVRAICIDSNGNVFVTGEIYETSGGYNFSTIKYNSSGLFQWERNFTEPMNGNGGSDIVSDNTGNVYVTGGSNDYVTIKYNSNGDSLWSVRYNGLANLSDIGISIAVDKNGKIFVTGRSRLGSGSSNYEIVTVKYSQTLTGTSAEINYNKNFILSQNYPNPFNPLTKIHYVVPVQISLSSNVIRLSVFNISGKEIYSVVRENQLPGRYTVEIDGSKLPSGIYLYTMNVNSGDLNFSETKKMVLLK